MIVIFAIQDVCVLCICGVCPMQDDDVLGMDTSGCVCDFIVA